MSQDWIIYGANGFTGKLIAERAKERGLRPILAGRRQEAIASIASNLDLPYRVFSLDDPGQVVRGLEGARLVLHCAGPYSKTSRPMVDGCLEVGAHYLDITGEYSVLEAVLARDESARRQKIVLLPAVGFDVIPTDCMAKKLSEEMPDAVELELAFTGGLKPSPGTAKTTVEGLPQGGRARRGGRIVDLRSPVVERVPFARGTRSRMAMSIPWGDLVTAYRSTGIGDITVYTEAPPALVRGAKMVRFVAPLLRTDAVQRFLKRQAERRATGPSEAERRAGKMWIWGRVRNAARDELQGHLQVPDGYELTVTGSLACVEGVLRGDVGPGATTPSLAFGSGFVTELPGVGAFELDRTKTRAA